MTVVPAPLDDSSCDTAVRGSFLHFTGDPDLDGDAWQYLEDGLLVLRKGRVFGWRCAADGP